MWTNYQTVLVTPRDPANLHTCNGLTRTVHLPVDSVVSTNGVWRCDFSTLLYLIEINVLKQPERLILTFVQNADNYLFVPRYQGT